LYFEASSADECKEWMQAIKLCVSIVKSGKEDRESSFSTSKYGGKRSQSLANLPPSITYGERRGWESIDDRPDTDTKRLLTKAHTESSLDFSSRLLPARPDLSMNEEALVENSAHSHFSYVEQWDLEHPEKIERMGMPSKSSSLF
jgi:hypothetical protein